MFDTFTGSLVFQILKPPDISVNLVFVIVI